MKIYKKLQVLILVALIAKGTSGFAVTQPQSTIPDDGDDMTLFDPDGGAGSDDISNGNATALTLSTPETPVAPDDCWDPEGDPDYYWDFGPLDGVDNGDGTATIYPDIAGDYDVTVYCGQQFVCKYDSNNTDYEETLPADPDKRVQDPASAVIDPNNAQASGTDPDNTVHGLMTYFIVMDGRPTPKAVLKSGGKIIEDIEWNISAKGQIQSSPGVIISGTSNKEPHSKPGAQLEQWETTNLDSNGAFKDLIGLGDPATTCGSIADAYIFDHGGTIVQGMVWTLTMEVTAHTYSITTKDGHSYDLDGNFVGEIHFNCQKTSGGGWVLKTIDGSIKAK